MKERERERKREYYQRPETKERRREYQRERHLITTYNLTMADYNEMWRQQFGRCLICGVPMKSCKVEIDHSHGTSKVRGILCQHCNRGLGAFYDNIQILYNAIEYLRISDTNNVDKVKAMSA